MRAPRPARLEVDVARNPQQPRGQARIVAQRPELPMRPDEGLLGGLVRGGLVPEEVAQEAPDGRGVLLEEGAEGGRISPPRACEQPALGLLRRGRAADQGHSDREKVAHAPW